MKAAAKTQKPKRQEEHANFISWRFALLCGCILLALAFLLGRVAWLQVISPDMLVKEGDMPAGIKAGNGFTRTMAPREGDSVEEKPLPLVHAEPFAFYKNFAAACAGKAEKAIKREEVVRVYKLMEAAARSAAENIVIKEKI